MRLSELKAGQALVASGRVYENDIPVATLNLWTIKARARRGDAFWDFVRNMSVANDVYMLVLDTNTLAPGDVEFDVRFEPPGGAAPFYSETFTVRIIEGMTP